MRDWSEEAYVVANQREQVWAGWPDFRGAEWQVCVIVLIAAEQSQWMSWVRDWVNEPGNADCDTTFGGSLQCDLNLISTDAPQCSGCPNLILIRHLHHSSSFSTDTGDLRWVTWQTRRGLRQSHRLPNISRSILKLASQRSSSEVPSTTCFQQSVLHGWHCILLCTVKPAMTAAQKIKMCTILSRHWGWLMPGSIKRSFLSVKMFTVLD